MLLSRKVEQNRLLFDSPEWYKYLHLRTSRAQIIAAFIVWSLENRSAKLACFLTVSFSWLSFSDDLMKLMVLTRAQHLASCFFPFACCLRFSIHPFPMLKDLQQTLQKARLISFSSFFNQTSKVPSSYQESWKQHFYLCIFLLS